MATIRTDVQVSNDVLLQEIREVLSEFGAPNEAVFLGIPASNEDGSEGPPALSKECSKTSYNLNVQKTVKSTPILAGT